MVTIKFAFLVVIFSATSVYTTCIVDKFKSVPKPSNEDLCRKQFDSFIEALESNQRWAKESKLSKFRKADELLKYLFLQCFRRMQTSTKDSSSETPTTLEISIVAWKLNMSAEIRQSKANIA